MLKGTPIETGYYKFLERYLVPALILRCEIVAGRRTITADTNLRLCRLFRLFEGYWLRGQVRRCA